MPLLIDADSRIGDLVRAINHVLIDHGPAGLTLRRIAHYSGVSTSSMLHHLGSKEHLLRVAAQQTAVDRRRSLAFESATDGVLAYVPRHAEEVLHARAWLAWSELWRAEPSLERVLREARADELAALARLADFQLSRMELDGLFALIEGLRVAVCTPVSPMSLGVAREILAAQCRALPGLQNPEKLGAARPIPG